jgi:hypothetical protein
METRKIATILVGDVVGYSYVRSPPMLSKNPLEVYVRE